MIKFERFLFNCLFGLVIPIAFFLAFWWGSLLFTNDVKQIRISAISGFVAGSIISIYLKLSREPDIYRLSKPVLIISYLFYNIGMLGFFMGVPVFNIIPGVIAGIYWTRRLIYNNYIMNLKSEIYKVLKFTSIVTGFICLISATIALLSKSTPADLKGMFNLPFDISQLMLVSFIFIGGLFLIFFQYFLTRIIIFKILKANNITLS